MSASWVRYSERGVWCQHCGTMFKARMPRERSVAGTDLEGVLEQLQAFLGAHKGCRKSPRKKKRLSL